MALHHQLPIYKTGCELVTLAVNVQQQMPRAHKRSLGEKIMAHCTEMVDLMAMANATRGHERAHHIRELLKRQHATTVLLRVSHSHHDRAILAKALMRRGHTINGNFTKTYRKAQRDEDQTH